jgi:6-pyruvoyl-tetrahydropterin synthase-like protein
MAHLVRADFGISRIVAHGRLDGWFPRFVLGHQEFLFNGPGLTWLMALVRAVTFGAASNEAALKIVSVASFVALPPAVCFLARSFGLGGRASGLSAVLSLLVSTPFGIGLRGLFETGLVPHQVGAVFFCLALGAAVRAADDDRRRWIVLLATSLATLAITHLISLLILGVVLALTLGLSAPTRRTSRPGLLRLALGCAGGAGLCGFWLVPFMAHRDLQGIVTTWSTPPLLERLGSILTGGVVFPAGLGVLVIAAWTSQLVKAHRQRDPSALIFLVTPPAYILVAHGLPHLLGLNGATLQLANRGLGYAGLLAILAVAALLADASRRFGRRGYAVTLGLTAVVAVTAAPGRGSAGEFPTPVPAMAAAASELARLVPDGARFATERDFPAEIRRTGVVHPETWLAYASGRNSLNGFNVEASSTPLAALVMNKLDELSATRLALRLNRYGVTHVVATSDDFVRRLTRSARFHPVWAAPPLTILALQPAPGSPEPASQVTAVGPAAARQTRAEPEHLGFEVDTPAPTGVTLALAWSPKWHALLNGAPVRLGKSRDGLVDVTMPAGHSALRLDYQSDVWDGFGLVTTLATVAAGGLATARCARRRRTYLPSPALSSSGPSSSAAGAPVGPRSP